MARSHSLTLILGGARSGKSQHAERLAAQRGGMDVLFVATAEALDDEMRLRIAHHQASRPADWGTLEAPRDVGSALRRWPGKPAWVVLDCLTLLVSNLVLQAEAQDGLQQAQLLVDRELDGLLEWHRDSGCGLILVSNELGLGLVPMEALSRTYRDVLGRANARLAAAADEVLFLVAGLPMSLKSPAIPPEAGPKP